jgi:hypothetical protein
MGNAESASHPSIEVFHLEQAGRRRSHRTSARDKKRKRTGYYAQGPQGAGQGLVAIMGRRGLSFRSIGETSIAIRITT